MAITVTNNHNFFNHQKNLLIIFKDYDDSNIEIKKENDFVFLFSNNNLVGINVFNFANYFEVEQGYHLINNDIKNYLLNNYPNYINESHFDPFYKIGLIIKIENHPNSEKLKVLEVEFSDRKRQIITNVQTLETNKKYLFATNGSITFSGLKIIDSKVMNIESQGMIMSYKSLGIDKDEIIETNQSLEEIYKF